MTNLSRLLEDTAAAHPDRVAAVLGDTRLTYRQLDDASNRVANLLVARGIARGETVALSCPNLPYFPIVYFGILKMGGVVLPLNVLLTAPEVAYHLKDAEAVALFAFEGSLELPIGDVATEAFEATDACRELLIIDADPRTALSFVVDASPDFESVDTPDDDVAVVLYTSGTTGQPKGAELRHRNMRDNALAARELLHSDIERPDVVLAVLPLFHVYGQSTIQNAGFAFGATLVLQARFDPAEALRVMVAEQVTSFSGVPTMYWALLDALDGTVDVEALASNLRVATSGGAALPGEIHRAFRERFGVTILEGYGLSETSSAASFAVFGEEPRIGSIGVPIPGVEMKLVHDDWTEVADDPEAIGEIAIKGHNVMKGYRKRPEATAEAIRDGWFRSGDLAKKDADGYYFIVDRSKDMIIRGGFNVYPREIEEVLMQHPAVSLAAVVGVPHDSHGEEIKAFVIVENGETLTADELRDWSRERLAAYKYPRLVEFIDRMPMTATGKILKRELSA